MNNQEEQDNNRSPGNYSTNNNTTSIPRPIITPTPGGGRTIQLPQYPSIRIHHPPRVSTTNPNNGRSSGESSQSNNTNNNNTPQGVPPGQPFLTFTTDGQRFVLRPGQSIQFRNRNDGSNSNPGQNNVNITSTNNNNSSGTQDGSRAGPTSTSSTPNTSNPGTNSTPSTADGSNSREGGTTTPPDDNNNTNTGNNGNPNTTATRFRINVNNNNNNNSTNNQPNNIPIRIPINPRHMTHRRINPPMRPVGLSSVEPLKPLSEVPLPIGMEKDTIEDGNNVDNELIRQFECPICFEIIENPAGCGSCDNRFCFKCLERSKNNDQNNENTPDNDNNTNGNSLPLKCPCCRKKFAKGVVDTKFQKRMAESKLTKSCPHPNCPERKIPLCQIKYHERTCDFMPVRCKYQPFGCKWTGPKKDVMDHYKIGCCYNKVSGLVEEIREFKHKRDQMIVNLHAEMARDRYQLNELRNIVAQNQQRQQQQLKMWSLPLMLFEMTSYTARFYQYIAQWHPLCGSANSRATVNNILYLLPSSIWTCKIGIAGLKKIANFLNGNVNVVIQDKDFPIASFESMQDMTQGKSFVAFEALLAFSIVSLANIGLACMFMDGAGPSSWSQMNIKLGRLDITRSFIRDKAAICSFFVHYFAANFDNELFGLKGSILLLALLTTTFFPPLITAMLGHTQALGLESESPEGKMKQVITFGIKYAFLFMIPSTDLISKEVILDSVLMYHISIKTSHERHRLRSRPYFSDSNIFLKDLPAWVFIIAISIRTGIILSTALEGVEGPPNDEDIFKAIVFLTIHMFKTFSTTVLVAIVHMFIYWFYHKGNKC